MLYRLAADVVVVLHMAYVLFVVVGFLLTLVGCLLRWQWIRDPWFRGIHLAMILVVVAEAWLGVVCPLTVWEQQLRDLAGEESYRGAFLANLVHDWLFYDAPSWVFTLVYSLFAAGVLATWIFAPPRRRARPEPRTPGGLRPQSEGIGLNASPESSALSPRPRGGEG